MNVVQRFVALLLFMFSGSQLYAAATPGNVGGSLNVVNGNLTYTIPVDAVAGRGGMQPQLALNYQGQGNGSLGAGWALTGYSMIHRCAATIAEDGYAGSINFDAKDRFCLNGQRLVLVNGSSYGAVGAEYRTRVDSYSKIVAYGGTVNNPQYFVAQTKAGHKVTFGNGGNATRSVSGGRLSWSTHKIQDTTNNTIRFHYFFNSNSQYLDYVVYPGGKVDIVYGTTRQNVVTAYSHGQAVTARKLISEVVTYNQKNSSAYTAVKRYRVTYRDNVTGGLAKVDTIKVCGSAGTLCTKPVQFDWPSASYGIGGEGSTGIARAFSQHESGRGWVDVDGDGRADMCGVVGSGKNDGGSWLRCQKGGDTTLGAAIVSDKAIDPGYEDSRWWVDFNGDGLTDFCRRVGNSYYRFSRLACTFSDGSKFTGGFVSKPINFGLRNRGFYDVTGDGRPDFCMVRPWRYDRFTVCYPARGNELSGSGGPSSFSVTLPFISAEIWWTDINADGMTDLCVQAFNNNYICYRSTGSGFVKAFSGQIANPGHAGTRAWVDVNGDGYPDFCRLVTNGAACTLTTGSGFGKTWYATTLGHGINSQSRWWVDVNADGFTDFCRIENINGSHKLRCSYSNGKNGFDSTITSSQAIDIGQASGAGRSWADIDGDGALEFVRFDPNPGSTDLARWTQLNPKPMPQITRITEANGLQTTIRYKRMTDSTFYSKGSGAVFPVVDVATATQLVSAIEADDGLGGTAKTSYKYYGLKTHTQGYGAYGFKKIEERYYDNGSYYKTRITEFDQSAFPRAGNVSKVTEKIGNTTINTAGTTYTVSSNNGVYRLTVNTRTDKSYELNGVLKTTVTTNNQQLDQYGNIGRVTVTTVGGGKTFTTQTVNHYDNITSSGKWHLGRLRYATVTHSASDVTANVVRRSQFDYLANGLLNKEYIVNPNNTADVLLQTTHQYNSYGQKTAVIPKDKTSYDEADRRTTTTFNDIWQVKSICNALGLCNHNTYYDQGWLKTAKDPNQQVVKYEYDDLGRTRKVTRPDNSYTTTRYYFASHSACGRTVPAAYSCVVTQHSTGQPGIVQLDKLGREVRKIVPGIKGRLAYTDTEYDSRGRVKRTSRPYFSGQSIYWAKTTYDRLDRVKYAAEPAPHGGVLEMFTTYNGFTTRVESRGETTRTKTTAINAMGKATRISEATGTYVEYSYTAAGDLKTTTVAGNSATTITLSYNHWGQKTRMVDPDMGTWEYRYNGYGDLKRQADNKASPNVVTMNYDRLGRITSRTEPEGSSSWVYFSSQDAQGSRGQLKQAQGLGLTKNYYYDTLGRVKEVKSTIAGETFSTKTTYDSNGRPSRTTYPGRQGFYTENIYNATTGHLEAIRGLKSQAETHNLTALRPLIADAVSLADSYTVKSRQLRAIAQDYQRWLDSKGVASISRTLTQHRTSLTKTRDKGKAITVQVEQFIPIVMDGLLIPVVGKKSLKLDAAFYDHWHNTIEELQTVISLLNLASINYANSAAQLSILATQTLAAADHSFNTGYALDEAATAYTSAASDSTHLTYWRALDADASGRISAEMYGNGIVNHFYYDQATGQLNSLHSSLLSTSPIKHLEYEYDSFNNVTTRHDRVSDIYETFNYDALDRLQTATVASSIYNTSAFNNSQTVSYNKLGNITYKSDIGNYAYNNSRPHAVSSAGGNAYSYDHNGNMLSGPNRSITWYSFNKPKTLTHSQKATSATFSYGPNRNRYKKVNHLGHTTLYIDGIYEKTTRNRQVEQKHYIYAAGKLVAEHIVSSRDGTQSRYLHTDALGSVDTVTDAYAEVVDRRSFDAWGKLRNLPWAKQAGLNDPLYITQLPFTNKGYTGHEQIAEVDLVHMNGRVYDPALGRFISADPHIQFAQASQSYNRYSYVLNNPMKYSDPTGFFLKKLFKKVGRALSKAWQAIKPYVGIIVAVVITIYCQVCGGPLLKAAIAGAASGAVSAAVNGGDILQAAIIGGLSGVAFAGIGASGLKDIAKIGLHGLTGGVASVLQGGKFGHGFLSAGFAKAVTTYLPFDKLGLDGIGDKYDGWEYVAGRTTVAAISGGTASVIGGGKFENGAKTAAVAHLLNFETGRTQQNNYAITEAERQLVADGKIQKFWESRLAADDPVAKAALASLNPPGGVVDYLFGGTSINNRLQAFANVYNDGVLNIDQIRVDLANAHIQFTDLDTSGVPGLLNPGQIAEYHHQVFSRHGLPSTAFGGTPFTGAVREAYFTRSIWCGGCDWK